MYTLILVDYNSMEKTVAYVRQFTQKIEAQGLVHTVIVDNGTEDDGLAVLQSEFGEVSALPETLCGRQLYRFADGHVELIYCRYGENAGYAKGNNLGMQIADAVFADPYYIISNNDLILPDSFSLDGITAKFSQNPAVAVIGPGVVGTDGKAQSPRKKQSAFTKLIAWYWGIGPLRKHVDDVIYEPGGAPCQWVMGCFFFARACAMHAVGGFDEKTFLYAEEMILSARLQTQDYTTVYDPVFTVIHDHKEVRRSASEALKTIRISFDSNCYYYKVYCGTSFILLVLARWSFALYRLLYPMWQMTKRPRMDRAN